MTGPAHAGIFRVFLLVSFALLIALPSAIAHPADELCGPGSELDRELCRALSELDSGDSAAGADEIRDEIVLADVARSRVEMLAVYARIGFQHILPGGADHILFVLAIFLSTRRIGALAWQVSAFTLAHTATLALVAGGAIAPSPAIVEPLIAATIAFVAFENLLFADMTRWRPLVVFGFGLIHGMGFAGAFGELGLAPGLFWTSLAGFNIGVELGQLAVLALALPVGLVARRLISASRLHADMYHRLFVQPVSACIGAVGLWWLATRLLATGG